MLKGIDLHSGQNIKNWNNIKNAGIEVVINKATEGTYYKDKYLSYRVGECKRLGIPIGVYHFAGHQDVLAEVNAFIEYTKGIDVSAGYWLDIEDVGSYSWKWTKSTAILFVNSFVSLFRQRAGKDIGLYCNKSFYLDYLSGSIDSNIKLWIANYGVNSNPFPNQSWQYSETGRILGENINFDMDLFQENILNQNGGMKKVKNIVCVNNSVDERAGKYLADYLQCPIIDNSLVKFDYTTVENVYCVGGGEFTAYAKKIIKGADRYATCQTVLNFIANGSK